jgi:CheY-like chemotaxis protein
VLTALVVDDDHADAEHAGRALTAAGYTVHLAFDATEAFALQAHQHPDLVVSDVSMPGCDGPTLLTALRAGGCTATFIAMTSDPTPEVRQRCQGAGAAICLPKPVNIAVLVAAAEQLLTHGPLRDPLEDPFDSELVDSMRASYLGLLPTRATALRDAANLTELTGTSHTLAGASAQFGYPGLAALCRLVELSARSGQCDPELVEAVLAAASHIQSTSR